MDNNILEQIKNYLMQKQAGANDQGYGTLQGFGKMLKQQQEIEGLDSSVQPSSAPVQGYAYGGIAGNSSQEDAFKMGLPQFNPQAGMPPTPPPPMPMPAPAPMPPVAPRMPVQAPNPVNQYLDTQKANLNKFGPEQQLAVSQDLMKQRQSLPQKGAVALGGIADALTRVGGGQSNYGGDIAGRQDSMAKEQMDSLEKAGTQNVARTEANMRLDAQDPRSELSKVAQQTWGPLLAQNGFTPDQVANMPAASIAALTGQSVESLKAKAESEMARATLGLNTQRFQSEDVARKDASQAREEEQQLGAAKSLAGRGMFKKISDTVLGDPGTDLLKSKLQEPTEAPASFTSEADAKDANLESGTIVIINGRKARVR